MIKNGYSITNLIKNVKQNPKFSDSFENEMNNHPKKH